MNPLKVFIIPVKGIKIGIHEFDFELDKSFFKAINPEIEIDALLQVHVSFDKRPTMYILDMSVKGVLYDACDRCLEKISIPVSAEHQLFIKQGIGEEDADIVYVELFQDVINIATYLYEYAILSFPMTKIIDCDEMDKPPCNFELLDKWEEDNSEDDEPQGGSIWDELNKLNLE